MGRQNTLTFFIVLLLCCKARACVLYFVVPEDQTVAEGMNETLRFSVNYDGNVNVRSCLDNITKSYVSISYFNYTGSDVSTPCPSVDLNPVGTSRMCNRTCSWTERGVDCNLTLVFNRNTTRWRLRAVYGATIPETIFTVNVTYATKLTQFKASENMPVDVSTKSVLLLCHWETGNPRRTVTIYNSHREVMNSLISGPNEQSGQLTYRIEPVSCHSSGVYTCEVEGQPETMTITVLVRCPVIFKAAKNTMRVIVGGTVEFRFTAQSHSSRVTSCSLTPPLPSLAHCRQTAFPCDSSRSRLEVKGEPWELSLTLWLSNITECDVGAWSLSLTNDFTREIINIPNPATALFIIQILDIPEPVKPAINSATHNSDLATQNSDLATHNSDLAIQNSDLATHNSDLATHNSSSATSAPWAAIVGVGVALIVVASIVSFIIGRQTGYKKGVCERTNSLLSKATIDLQHDPDGYLCARAVTSQVKATTVTPNTAARPQQSFLTTAHVENADGNHAGVYDVVQGQYDVPQLPEVGFPPLYDSIKH